MLLKLCILFGVIVVCYAEMMAIEPRVTGGVAVEIEDFPYAVSVQAPGGKGRTHFSTGTILSNRWILTTASRIKYFDDPHAFHIRTGSTHSNNPGLDYVAIERVQHPSYNPNKYDFDLALLKVDRDIEFSDKATSIGLFSEDSVVADLSGSLIGWGETYVNTNKVSRLYSMELKTTGAIDGMNLYITAIGDDACYSDVGGPFVVDGKVLGISTVNMLGCGLTDHQYVTRFDADTLEWINSVIQ